MTSEHNFTNRRTVLKTAAIGVSGLLAGCSSGSDNTSSATDDNSNGPEEATSIDSASVQGNYLRVELINGNPVERVSVLSPDGTELTSKQVSPGVTVVQFNLLRPYSPGKHRIVGISGDSIVDEATISLQPNVEITNAVNAWSVADSEPSETLRYQVGITVQNTGTAPQKLDQLEFEGTPNPVNLSMDMESGMLSHKNGATIQPNETTQIYSETRPLDGDFDPKGLDCGEKGEMVINVDTLIGPSITAQYRIEASTENAEENCPVTIGDRL